ncbi:MAG: A/G-specific adenine glycosylase [Planctomycetota bacterium]
MCPPPRSASAPAVTAQSAGDFPVAALLDWYRANRRELPFRPTDGPGGRKANPYHVLVSEAMAQQTQIATVVPYFERFVAAFPTVRDLADADEQRVLTLWQGLGYYRRARNLRAAARMVIDDFAGKVPDSVEDLLKLPGVGRYTAGAIASIAYNRPAPIVDGNVARVFARYFLIEQAVDQPATLKQLWQLAGDLVETSDSPRDFNQSVMELGALVCTPKSTKCLYCPLRDSCAAHAAGRVDALPVKTPKKKPVAVTHTVLAIERRGKYLFEQRPADGLWANMWQMPTIEDAPRDALAGPDLRGYIRDRFNLAVTAPTFISYFTHQTTHRTIRFEVHHCRVETGRLTSNSGRWRTAKNLDDLPLAKPQLIAVSALGSGLHQCL